MSLDGLIQVRGRAITIEQPVEAQNSRGETIVTGYTTAASVRALVQPLSGRELLAAQQTFADVTHRIVLMFIAGITPKMRVNDSGTVYDILESLNVESRSRHLELRAVQRGA